MKTQIVNRIAAWFIPRAAQTRLLPQALCAGFLLAFLCGATARGAENTVTEFSTRTRVGAGDEMGISGFSVRGSGSKSILIRVLGPSLTDSGISAANVLENPVLQINDGSGTAIFANDDWQSFQETEIQATGHAPSNEFESAIRATFAAGSYTAIFGGRAGGVGVAQIDIFDLDSPQPASTYLSFIASRGFAGTGDNTMSVAFTLTGPDFTNMITRLLGPSLSFAGGVGFSTDPAFALHASDGTLILANDDWKERQRSDIEATGFQPSDDKESAIALGLNTGRYVAIAGGPEGKVLFEATALSYPDSSPAPTPIPLPGPPTPTPSPTSTPAPTPAANTQLLNIATRMRVQTGENVLIGGFIITGTDAKKVLIRGIGPSLAQFFSGSLSNPTLELFQGETLLASNDDWKESQQGEIEDTGIPPSHDLESAIVRTLDPGAYTAIVRGSGDASGIGVVEAYDLDQAANSKLANIATRGFVDTDDNVMIGGVIVGPAGGLSVQVVVRAIGPSLSNFGINGALQDPTLELVNSDGVVLRSNDNWKDEQQVEIEGIGLQPGDDRESALVQTVAPGNYTAIVRGADNTIGVGLVEVYNVQ